MSDHTAHGPAALDRRRMTLVNREQELFTLFALLRDARAGTGGVVLLEGPVGIGKSMLLRSLASTPKGDGIRVLEARCDALERDFPFGVVRQLFEPLLASLDGPERARLMAGNARAAAQALSSDALSGEVTAATEDVSYAVLHGLYWFTANLAERSPVVIVVDDAHCADVASLRFLVHLARRIEGLPVLLALSQRTGGEVTGPALLDEVAAQPLCHVLRPQPLTLDGVAELVRCTLSEQADERFHTACLAATGGIPLLVHALLTGVRMHGERPTEDSLEYAAAHEGTFFNDAVLCVLRRQPESALAAARAMAVMGDSASAELCARLAGLDGSALVSAMRVLEANGLVAASEDGGTWSFNHGLVRETILADMPPAGRAEAHRRAARLLLDEGARAEQVAGHLLMTELPATSDWAVTVLRDAAREASFRGAPALAVDLLRHCLREQVESETDVAVLVELGFSESVVDAQASVRHLQLALEHVTDPARRFRVLSALTRSLVRSGRSLQAVRLLTEHAPAIADTCDDLGRGLEAQRLMASVEDLRSFRITLADYPFALGLAGDTPGERALLAARAAISAVREEQAAEAAGAARRMLERSVPGTDSPFFQITSATALLYTGQPGEADAAFQRILDGTRQTQSLLSFCLSTALRAEAAYRRGALLDALAAVQSALALSPPDQWGRSLALPVATRIHTLLDFGDLEGARAAAGQEFAPSSVDTWQWNEFLCARGRLRLELGEPQEALVDLLECGRREHQWTRTSPAVSSWWVWAAAAHLALGAPGRARELAEDTVRRARRGGLRDALGAALRVLATTLAAPGDRLALLEEAMAAVKGSPARLERARVLVDYGAALHDSGRTEAARDTLRQGLDLAHAIGANVLRGRAHEALLATGARPRRSATRGLEALTPSEGQVGRLAAAGGTNRQIAEELFVTQRTVELHLTSVYRKLGVAGRRELGSFFGNPERGRSRA